MTRAAVTFLAVAGVSLLALCSLGCQEYDRFYSCELGMTTDRLEYQVGDVITLTATVTPPKKSRIHLYSEREKSFDILLRSMVGDSIDFQDSDFWNPTRASSHDRIDTIEISPTAPFVLSIEGHITLESDKSVRFDFGNFGSFTKPREGRFMVGGFWNPAHPGPGDSREDFTDKVVITVRGTP